MMLRKSVSGGRIFINFGWIGLLAALVLASASPADAARRKRSAGGYSPPYAAMVVDAKTGRVLQAENENALRHPASITKVMTLYILFEQLEHGRFNLETPLRVSAYASRQAPSKLGLDPGETILVEDAIKALVTKSANDVAVTIAENIAGSEEAFAEIMTRKARSLGMSRTIYRNASGLPNPEQVTTASDLILLARAIQDRFPRYYSYFQTRGFSYAGEFHRNHNKLLGRVEGVDGIKTGYTRASGFNLMTSAKSDGRHVVVVVLGGRSGPARDRIVEALLETHLPRAYAGARTAPMVAEASERPRPAVVAESARGSDVETTATTPVSRPQRSALDLDSLRAVPTTTPSNVRAYAALDSFSPQPRPVEAEKPVYVASLTGDVTRPPARMEPAKMEAPKVSSPSPQARPGAASNWIIQLGATDEEQKAKNLLEQARQRSGRVLSKASPFTEKVTRDGATLYRARFSGFAEPDDAQEACRSLKQSGFSCFASRS